MQTGAKEKKLVFFPRGIRPIVNKYQEHTHARRQHCVRVLVEPATHNGPVAFGSGTLCKNLSRPLLQRLLYARNNVCTRSRIGCLEIGANGRPTRHTLHGNYPQSVSVTGRAGLKALRPIGKSQMSSIITDGLNTDGFGFQITIRQKRILKCQAILFANKCCDLT